MVVIPSIPESAPFSPEQRAWINGYIAGLMAQSTSATAVPTATSLEFTILYGTQTGTSEMIAHKVARSAKGKGLKARVVNMNDFTQVDLTSLPYLLVITSTYGDGNMPDNAQAFWDYLKADSAPSLTHLQFSVLALGDTNYTQFCQSGKRFDQRLEELGAKRLHTRVDCDTDYEKNSEEWTQNIIQILFSLSGSTSSQLSVSSLPVEPLATSSAYSKTNPYPASLVTNRLLTKNGSGKEIRHFEFSLKDSGISYEVGDALGVWPQNCPDLVDEILKTKNWKPDEIVQDRHNQPKPLRDALIQDYEIHPLLASEANITSSAEVSSKLKKLSPRLYSISSSPKAFQDQVHLTVSVVRYELNGIKHKGVCSTFLADRTGSTKVPIFIQTSHGFRLPTNYDAPVIMIGPGTGVAPFRAFLHERLAVGAKGKNWLFFGEQRSKTDFYYEEEFIEMFTNGHLTKLDTAFSRDQSTKIYVQHRMEERAKELWDWLESGAYAYVCGDAMKMAKDVDEALHLVCEKAGNLSKEAASEYVKKLKAEKRYLRDVY